MILHCVQKLGLIQTTGTIDLQIGQSMSADTSDRHNLTCRYSSIHKQLRSAVL